MWVIRVVLTLNQPLPVYPDQQTSPDQSVWSVSCQQQETYAAQQKALRDCSRGRTHSRRLAKVDCSNFYFVFSNTRRLLCIPLSAQLGIIRHVEVT
jgi:hypothetical protein